MNAIVTGIDVSKHNPSINWQAAKAWGLAFAIIKATEGIGYVDPLFSQHYQGAGGAGLPQGVYHFFRPGSDPIQQARHFFTTVEGIKDRCELKPALDFEPTKKDAPLIEAMGIEEYGARCKAIAVETERLWGCPPLVYSYTAFLNAQRLGEWLSCYPLWQADYRSAPGKVSGWVTPSLWQKGCTQTFPWASGPLDVNVVLAEGYTALLRK